MKTLSVVGDKVVVLLSGEETRQQYVVMEATVPPGAGPPHLHFQTDETFLVLSGEITFYLGEKIIPLARGGFIFAPQGIPHHFKNTGREDAILLETAAPAGIEHFFEKAGHPLSGREDRPLPVTAADIERLRLLAPEFGIQILSPKKTS
jgi:mannose-6-phosphate isomerase-like protein (cupin superfamily)